MTKSELIEKYAEEIWTVSADSTKKSEYADILTRLLSEYDAQRGVEGWHREAAIAKPVAFGYWVNALNAFTDITLSKATAQRWDEQNDGITIVPLYAHPATNPTAPKEVIEKYAAEIEYSSLEGSGGEGKYATIGKEEATAILTRFASEITVDAGKVFDALVAIWAPTYADPDSETTPSQQFTFHTTMTKENIAAALKSAGGGK